MAVTEAQVKLVTHTARMLLFAQQHPNHDGAKDHAKVMRKYRVLWEDLTPQQQKEAAELASKIHDMRPDLIDAALSALEVR